MTTNLYNDIIQNMVIKESEEMYLETILLLKKECSSVRSVDIVDKLGYAKSSVSRAVNLLEKNGYITINRESGVINFTDEGRERAQNIYERHRVFTEVLMKIGASKELAEDNACRIEHVISDEMYDLIKNFLEEHS